VVLLLLLNPEILAPFMDLIVIGEAEEIFPLILALWKEGEEKGKSREEKKKDSGEYSRGVYPRWG